MNKEERLKRFIDIENILNKYKVTKIELKGMLLGLVVQLEIKNNITIDFKELIYELRK